MQTKLTSTILAAPRKLLARLHAIREQRQARLMLSAMSDRELKDIGLVRSQLATLGHASPR